MMKNDVLKIALRNNALLVPKEWQLNNGQKNISETTSVLVANASKLGYSFSEDLLFVINGMSPKAKFELLALLQELKGVNKNWTPLVKQWNVPTGESIIDHITTWFANVFQINNGTKLPCGHLIPNNTFPLERYNGCPFCGTPFEFERLVNTSSNSKLTVLELWNEEDAKRYLDKLLSSPVALDATQADSTKFLLKHFKFTEGVEVRMKETMMLVIDAFVEMDEPNLASQFFKTPNDILRYLWFKHTGFLQIVEPKTIVNRMQQNAKNGHRHLSEEAEIKTKSTVDLKLKYNRKECLQYAKWLNGLSMNIQDQCELMHPKRGMWIRVIRALRLAEYSKRKGFEKLAKLLDAFYNEDYVVWQGELNQRKLKSDPEGAFKLLKQRPGLFARSLFSTMLWFGPESTIKHFNEIINKVPPRLIFTLSMYAEIYFDKNESRTVKPLGGKNKRIDGNRLLQLYPDEVLSSMQMMVKDLYRDVLYRKFKGEENSNKTIFIAPELFSIPISVGDRSEHVQDLQHAAMGTRFKVEGDSVRLFLQWGEGLPAQHLDMDLSCNVSYKDRNEFCSYSQLVIPGCKHSGDIQRIPEKVGTAEYIELDLEDLAKLGAQYVSFTCNAYTSGSLAPNLVVGWMNSKAPMKISSSGVAYNPANVQHQVRIKQQLTKGMVFGLLDVNKREIVWLEMSFGGQVVHNLNVLAVESLLRKLDAKLKIGDLLRLKAEVQNLEIVNEPAIADESYDSNWALNSAEVAKLFLE